VRGGFARLVDERRIGLLDRVMRAVYDGFGVLHDPALRLVLPIVDGLSEADARERLIARLPLAELERLSASRPLRALDVSYGTGGELLGLARVLPRGTELFGVDLSSTMARLGRRNLRRAAVDAALCVGDAHHLPYADDAFDLVVHVGGINAFSDRARGLSEMVRVARPGAPIFVVDERLDRSGPVPRWQRALFRAITWWDPVQEAPVDLLPPGVEDVEVHQVLRFYYLMSFRAPAADPVS